MYSLAKREMRYVSPEDAKHFLSFNNFKNQRDVRADHVNELAEKMQTGLFRFGEIAMAKNGDGRTYMLNGQHVCHAIVESGLSQSCIFEEFKADNSLDMSTLFKQFEILPRSISDMIAVEKDALRLDWTKRLAGIVVSAAALIEQDSGTFSKAGGISVRSSKNGKPVFTKERRVNLLKKYIREGEFLKEILFEEGTGARTRHMERSIVAAMMIKTWRLNRNDAKVFWTRVRDGENLTLNMPEYLIRQFLLSHYTINGRQTAQSYHVYRKATNHEIACRISNAWNAFREGRSLTTIKYSPERSKPNLK